MADFRWGAQIPLRDGVKLNANIYLPEPLEEPAPAIMCLTPYIAQSVHARGLYFARAGYVFVAVDARGRGNSDGQFIPMRNEGPDGYDVVEWIAAQSFCDGQVAMWGGSYAGYDQWMTAAQAPPHLATIVPVAAPFGGVDLPFLANIPKPYHIQWMMLVAGRTAQDAMFGDQQWWRSRYRAWFESGRSFTDIDTFMGMPSAHWREWAQHPTPGPWWDAYNPSAEQYRAIDMPVLSITGICDGDQPGALAHYTEHLKHASAGARANHYLIMGPWDHAGTRDPKLEFAGIKAGPASLVDLGRLHVEWYDWVMRGGARPAFLADRVSYYVLGADAWRYTPALEAVTAAHRALYPAAAHNPDDVYTAGELRATAPDACPPAVYVYDPLDVRHAALEETIDPASRSDDRMVYARAGRHLVYHSAPFESDIDISGFFKLDLWLSIDQPDTDIRAWVYGVGPDGRATLLAVDSVRARYREDLRRGVLLTSDAPLMYRFERFTFIATRLAQGSRLRLVIGPVHSIHSQRNFNSGGTVADETSADARTVTVRLLQDAVHRSVLHVPIDHRSPTHV